ncbi:MAG: glycosyltransferase family 2 protein [Candidatus Kariarchaeaceae archaeon]
MTASHLSKKRPLVKFYLFLKNLGKNIFLISFFIMFCILAYIALEDIIHSFSDWVTVYFSDPLNQSTTNHMMLLFFIFLFGLILIVVAQIAAFFIGPSTSTLIIAEPLDYDLQNIPKTVVIIPAYNEEATIKEAIEKVMPFCHEVIVIDDGSTDRTAENALKTSAKVFKHRSNQGLGMTYRDAVSQALSSGAELIVGFDADLQYRASEIPLLLTPILRGDYDLVMGSRLSGTIEKMPILKRVGNILFTKLIGSLINLKISDGQSGFRAYTAELAQTITIRGEYTYTQEMIVEAAAYGFRIAEVPIHFDKRKVGESRLMKGALNYAFQAGLFLVRVLRDHHAMKVFGTISAMFIVIGLSLGQYILIIWLTGIDSEFSHGVLALSALSFISMGLTFLVLALIADMKDKEKRSVLVRLSKKD